MKFFDIRPEIKYPRQGEVVDSPMYTICVYASACVRALEVSIDQGPWRACRKEVGYWWYEWENYDDGPHTVIARTAGQGGRRLLSAPREVSVDILMKRRGPLRPQAPAWTCVRQNQPVSARPGGRSSRPLSAAG